LKNTSVKGGFQSGVPSSLWNRWDSGEILSFKAPPKAKIDLSKIWPE
jgi:hypothetical protein